VNRYSQFGEPQAVLDFHGLGRVSGADVKRETIAFVRDAYEQGLERVRIVTGKGLHSAGRPVVRPQVERTLRSLESEGLVASYRPEKVQRGGDGALFVRLTRSP
jgi:DNA-nicking Smr family endonuclease